MSETLDYILSVDLPKEFRGKENWLGVKMSPHTPMLFINKVTREGVETNAGSFTWDKCSTNIINTIYQRLKLNEATNK